MSPQEFHIGDILSITDGHLVSPRHIDGVYDILNFMTGDDLFTHQLPRAMDECQPFLRVQHPELASIIVPDGLDTWEKVNAYLADLAAIHGEYHAVAPLNKDDHTEIHPITELKMMRPDAKIIEVKR